MKTRETRKMRDVTGRGDWGVYRGKGDDIGTQKRRKGKNKEEKKKDEMGRVQGEGKRWIRGGKGGGGDCVILKMEVMLRSKVQGWLRKKRKSQEQDVKGS